MLDAEILEMMIRDELDDLSVHSRGVYKTTLRRVGEALNPSWMGQTIYKKHVRTTSQPPYTRLRSPTYSIGAWTQTSSLAASGARLWGWG